MPDLNDDLDRAMGARFGALSGTLASSVSPPPPEEIIARARRRRRNGQALLGGFAVLAVLASAGIALGPLRPGGRSDAADPKRTPLYAPPAGAARALLGETIPPGFLAVTGKTEEARLEPMCGGTASFDTNWSIIAASAVSGENGERTTLLVYPPGMVASKAYGEYRSEATRCVQSDKQSRRTVGDLRLGGEGFRVTTLVAGTAAGQEAVIRYGTALLMVRGAGETTIKRAGDLERSLCVFASDCQPRDGRPSPLTSLAAGGEAWAAVLAVEPSPEATSLGRAVASGSTLGYRTSVTSVDCDEGAREALGLPAGEEHWYVPVYFSSRTAAEAFAKGVPGPVRTIQVRTYCLG